MSGLWYNQIIIDYVLNQNYTLTARMNNNTAGTIQIFIKVLKEV